MASPEMVTLSECIASLRARVAAGPVVDPTDAQKAAIQALRDQLMQQLTDALSQYQTSIVVVQPTPEELQEILTAINQLLVLLSAVGAAQRLLLTLMMSMQNIVNGSLLEELKSLIPSADRIPTTPSDVLATAQAELMNQLDSLRKQILGQLLGMCKYGV